MFYAYVSHLLFTFCHRSLGCQSFPPLLGLVPGFKKRLKADNLNPDQLVTRFVAPYRVRTHLEKMKIQQHHSRPASHRNTEAPEHQNPALRKLSHSVTHDSSRCNCFQLPIAPDSSRSGQPKSGAIGTYRESSGAIGPKTIFPDAWG